MIVGVATDGLVAGRPRGHALSMRCPQALISHAPSSTVLSQTGSLYGPGHADRIGRGLQTGQKEGLATCLGSGGTARRLPF